LFWTLAPFLVLLTVWQQASVDRLVVALERNRDARTQLESQVNALRLEADRLSSLGQVEARAEKELGLIQPGTDQIVDLIFPGSEGHDGLFHLKPLVGEALAGTSENTVKR
jgi:hypothetical protein